MVELRSPIRLIKEGKSQNSLDSLGEGHVGIGANHYTVKLACKVKGGVGTEGERRKGRRGEGETGRREMGKG
jgi:hypothetical protein